MLISRATIRAIDPRVPSRNRESLVIRMPEAAGLILGTVGGGGTSRPMMNLPSAAGNPSWSLRLSSTPYSSVSWPSTSNGWPMSATEPLAIEGASTG